MTRDAIEMELTPAERSLLLRYGYPFERIETAFGLFRQQSRGSRPAGPP